MVRRSTRLVAAVALLAPLCMMRAAAQGLPKVHVTTLTMRADTAHPQLERPFHLIISAHFAETLRAVDFLVLPNLAELEDLGDERHLLGSTTGTDFSETVTVVAHHTGAIHVDPAYFNAIDARDGKPKRFSSNDLTLTVAGGALEDPLSGLRSLLVTAAKLAAAGVVLFIAGVLFLSRSKPPKPPPRPIAQEPPAPVRSLRDRLREGLERLKGGRTRADVMNVRKTLWEHAGAREGQTLSDVAKQLGDSDTALQLVLRSTERAAFIQEAYLQGAIDDMIAALERHTV